MSDDSRMELYETKAELIQTKEELEKNRKEYEKFKSQMTVNSLMKTVDDFQIKFSRSLEAIQENFNTLSLRVSNNDQILSEIRNTLRQQNETLGTINQTLNKQNETIKVLKTNVGNQSFMCPIDFSERETILLLGGWDGSKELDSLLILENNRQNWKQLTIKLPYAVQHHGAQFLNNNIYIFGGYGTKGPLGSTYKLSKNLQWEKMADMNQKRSAVSTSNVILNNQIWVCGGFNGNERLKSVEMYDPQTNKWKYMKEMNQCRSTGAAAVVNGKIFCSGGWNGVACFNSVEYYDPSSDVWTFIFNMSESINGHGSVEMDGNLIVMGGWNRREHFRNLWTLNTTKEITIWIATSFMSIPRNDFSIAKIDGEIFICGGGSEAEIITDSVEIFDGEVWRNGPKMPTPRTKAAIVVIPREFARYLK